MQLRFNRRRLRPLTAKTRWGGGNTRNRKINTIPGIYILDEEKKEADVKCGVPLFSGILFFQEYSE